MTPFISASHIAIRIGKKVLFTGDSWTMNKGEHWAILGPNGSGKSTFARALAGRLPTTAGAIICHFGDPSYEPYPISQRDHIGYLSFETHRSIVEKHDREAEFMSIVGKEHTSETVSEYLGTTEILPMLKLQNLAQKHLSHLSTGEMRKVLIVKIISHNPELLILDEPFEGLDLQSKQSLIEFIDSLSSDTFQTISITHHIEELLPSITHVMMIQNGHIFKTGKRTDIMTEKNIHNLFSLHTVPVPKKSISKPTLRHEPIIEMSHVTVRHGAAAVLDDINWTMHSGENWMIVGPNGAGKSTLVKLIMGENVQVYSNHVKIFGHQNEVVPSITHILRLDLGKIVEYT